jgi:hypothetical protein
MIADAPGPVGTVQMTLLVLAAHEGKVLLEPQVKQEVDATPAREPAPVALGGYLPD